MYTDIIERNGMVYCWYRDPDDNSLSLVEEPAPYQCYRKNDKDGDHLSLFGDAVSEKIFSTRQEMKNYCSRRDGLFESDIAPIYKYLSKNFYQLKDSYVNVGFFDIEVDYDLKDGFGYPVPDSAFGEINSFSLYDCRKEEYHLITLHENVVVKPREGETLTVHHCVTERQLIDTFVKVIEDIDLLSAWNGDKYDIPYILERCIYIYGEREGLKKLCRDGFSATSRVKNDDWGNQYLHYNLVGRTHIDYMELFKKFTFGERDSYALNSIVEEELGENKLQYVGDLGDMYRSDPAKFFEYSLHDSRLMKLLDDKKKFINTSIAMAGQATIKFNEVLGSIKYLEHSIMNHCHFDRKEYLCLPDKRDADRQPFAGGFVLETTANGYGWTTSIDLAGLYPSTIQALNISPETYMFLCKKKDRDFIKVVEQQDISIEMLHVPTNETIIMKGYEVYDMIREERFTISANGCIFSNEQGLLPEILEIWASQRKKLKRLSFEAFKNGNEKDGIYYDMSQNLMKLNQNSLYGAISNPYSRFYDINLAASVTLSGQIIEKYQIWKSDQLIKGKVSAA